MRGIQALIRDVFVSTYERENPWVFSSSISVGGVLGTFRFCFAGQIIPTLESKKLRKSQKQC